MFCHIEELDIADRPAEAGTSAAVEALAAAGTLVAGTLVAGTLAAGTLAAGTAAAGTAAAGTLAAAAAVGTFVDVAAYTVAAEHQVMASSSVY